MGYPAYRNNLGNVIVTAEGENNEKEVALSAHVDTLGLMVRSITSDGHLMFTPVGGPIIPTLDGEYCRIYTRAGKVYTGTILSLSPAIHVHPDAETRVCLLYTSNVTDFSAKSLDARNSMVSALKWNVCNK